MHPVTINVLPRLFALVPCAGVGERASAGGPKQYAPLAGQAMVAHTLAALGRVPRLSATLVVLAPQDAQFECHLPGFENERHWVARCGGDSRAESVANGLDELLARGAQPHDWVLVHDAARCLLRPQWVERLIDACLDDEVGGLLALPMADTLKQASSGQVTGEQVTGDQNSADRIAATLPRHAMWAAQTPQMFRLGLLRPALAHAGDGVTDESSAVEALGHAPLLVRGEVENFKLTYPGDFALAERLLRTSAP